MTAQDPEPDLFPRLLAGGDPIAFCTMLRESHGFAIGMDEMSRVAGLLAVRARLRKPIETAEEALRLLSPVLARSAAEQSLLEHVIGDAFDLEQRINRLKAAENLHAALVEERGSDAQVSPQRRSGPLRRRVAIAWAAMILIALALGVYSLRRSDQPVPIAPDIPIVEPASPLGMTGRILALMRQVLALFDSGTAIGLFVAILALAGAAAAGFFWVRRLAAERDMVAADSDEIELAIAPGGAIYFAEGTARNALQRLTRHRSMPSRRIDVARTIRATTRAGNQLRLIRRHRLQQPEFTVLFDRQGADDQMRIMVEDLVAGIMAQNIHVNRYDYTLTPDRLFLPGQAGHVANFAQVISEVQTREAILIADPRRLVQDDVDATPQPWLRDLVRAGSVTVISSIPIMRLGLLGAQFEAQVGARLIGPGEAALGRFEAISADRQALLALKDVSAPESLLPSAVRLNSDSPPGPGIVIDLRRWLLRYLSLPARDLLAALTLYPQITPDLTRALAHHLKTGSGDQLATGPRLAEVAGLPWLRAARVPDWARRELQALVPPRRLEHLRAGVSEVLAPVAQGKVRLALVSDRRPALLQRLGAYFSEPVQAKERVVMRAPSRSGLMDLMLPRSLIGAQARRLALTWGTVLLVGLIAIVLSEYADLLDRGTLTLGVLVSLALPGIALHVLALGTAPARVRWLLWRGSWLGLSATLGLSLASPSGTAQVLMGSAALFACYILRGRPGGARPLKGVLLGTTWVGNLTLMATFLGVFYAIFLSVASSVFSAPFLAAPAIGMLALAMLRRLALPIRDLVLIPLTSAAMALVGAQLIFLANDMLGVFGLLRSVLGLSLSDSETLTGFVIIGALCVAALAAHLDWRGSMRHEQRATWPLSAGIVLTLMGGGPSLAVHAFLPAFQFGGVKPNADMLRQLSYLLGIPLLLSASIALTSTRGKLWTQTMSQRADGRVALFWTIVSLTLIGFYANDDAMLRWLIGLPLLSPVVGVMTLRYYRPELFGTPVWTVFDTYRWTGRSPGFAPAAVLMVPVVAVLLGFDYSVGSLDITLGDLAFPVAGWLGYRYGRAGFWVMAIGGITFLPSFQIAGLSTTQTPGTYFACLLLARVCGMTELRSAIFRTLRLTHWQLAFLCLGLAMSGSFFVTPYLGLVLRQSDYLMVILFLIGMSRVPVEQLVKPLAIVWAVSVLTGALRLPEFDSAIYPLTIYPTYSGLWVPVALALAFGAGRVLRRLILEPEAQLLPPEDLGLWIMALTLLSRIDMSLEAQGAIVDFRLNLDVIPHVALVLGYLGLGLLHGWRGVTTALAVEVLLNILEALGSVALRLLWPDAAFTFGIFRFSLSGPPLGLGVRLQVAGMALVLGYSLLAIAGAVLRRELVARSGPERRHAGSGPVVKGGGIVEDAGSSTETLSPQDADVSSARKRPVRSNITAAQDSPNEAFASDRAALTARPQLIADGHPALRALWLDRWAVASGVVMMLWLPLGAVVVALQGDIVSGSAAPLTQSNADPNRSDAPQQQSEQPLDPKTQQEQQIQPQQQQQQQQLPQDAPNNSIMAN